MKTDEKTDEQKVTCGVLFREQAERYCGSDPGKFRLFAIGFVNGQAEKVYLGACLGAMFRPSDEYRNDHRMTVLRAAASYGLHFRELPECGELWLLRNAEALALFSLLIKANRDSPEWHGLRGKICGVPRDERDPEFHLRKGAAERCELETVDTGINNDDD